MDREAYCARSVIPVRTSLVTVARVSSGNGNLRRARAMAQRLGPSEKGVPNKKEEKVLLTTASLELVENDCTNNNATLDNLLPIGRHIHQVESIVQYTDNQRTNNRPCNCPDSTSRKGGATDDRSRDGIKFVANAKPRLPRTNA